MKSEENNLKEYLRPFPEHGGESPLHITVAGMTYPDPTYFINRPSSGLWVIEYVLDGVGDVSVDGRYHRVTKDMVYFLHAGTNQAYHADADNPYSKIFMNVTGSMCAKIVSSYGLSGKNYFDGKGLKPLFERVMTMVDPAVPEGEAEAALQGLFVEILARLSLADDEPRYCEEAAVLRKYIDANPSRIVTADELAKLIFRSPDYCLKLFGKEFGTTPYAYQLERKLGMAKTLLSDTNMSIGEIAMSLGYSDAHYFSNLFLKKCGIRPLAYRNKRGDL